MKDQEITQTKNIRHDLLHSLIVFRRLRKEASRLGDKSARLFDLATDNLEDVWKKMKAKSKTKSSDLGRDSSK